MTFTDAQNAALKADLQKANVKSRAQAGVTLSYLEAWHVIAEANRIFGFDGWFRETVDLIQLGEPRLVDGKYRVGYRAKVRITVGGIVREGCGFGSGIDRDPDQAHESALKEAESDAMKRALMTFGNPFGLALYDKTKAHVTDKPPADDSPPPEQNEAYSRKSSAQAKKDGDDETIKREISGLDKPGLADFHAHFDEYTATMPRGWLDPIRDMLENRLIELNGAANVADAEAELDEGFRGTMGRPLSAPVAGRDRDVAHA